MKKWLAASLFLVLGGLVVGHSVTAHSYPSEIVLQGPDGVRWQLGAENGQFAIRNLGTNTARFVVTPNGGVGVNTTTGLNTYWFGDGKEFRVLSPGRDGNPSLTTDFSYPGLESCWRQESEAQQWVLKDCTNYPDGRTRISIQAASSPAWSRYIEFRAGDGVTPLLRLYDTRIEAYVPIVQK